MSLAQHIVIRFCDSRPLFVSLEERLRFSRTIARIGAEFRLLAWGTGDNHAHAGVAASRARALELARRLEGSLTKQLGLGLGFGAALSTEVRDQSHLRHSIPYMIGQGERHGVDDPFHLGSSLPDALGWRLLAPDLPSTLAELAPRVRVGDMVPALGDPPPPSAASVWVEAGVAARGLGHLRGRDALTLEVRRAVVAFAWEASSRELADLLGCGPRTVRRLRSRPPEDERAIAAVLAQARWRWGASADEAA